MHTVLLVEPNEPLRELTWRHLTMAFPRVEVVAVPDVDRGLAFLRAAPFDALVVARELPDQGACALLAVVAALEQPPLVIVTSVEPASPAQMARCPPATWLLKPYQLEDLEECLAAALQPSRR